jgi:NADH-quinone oxidoreductase subunit J
VQVVVYGGAIVVLFLFVIMLLGVDESENLKAEPLAMQRVLAVLVAFGTLALLLAGLFLSGPGGDDGAVALTGSAGQIESLNGVDPESELASVLPEAEAEQSNITRLARDLFTRNVLALEATALLLTIATIGAVVMVKNQNQPTQTVTEGQN